MFFLADFFVYKISKYSYCGTVEEFFWPRVPFFLCIVLYIFSVVLHLICHSFFAKLTDIMRLFPRLMYKGIPGLQRPKLSQ